MVEEVAYTWFNRICAIRFMEVNDYLPNRVRVLSSEKAGKMEPDLVTQAPDVDLDLTAQEKEEIEKRGGKVTGSVTSKTNYLINNDTGSGTAKNKKARELGIPIISEEDFLQMMNE